MAKTWIFTDEGAAALLEGAGALEALLNNGTIRLRTSADADLLSVPAHATAAFSVTGRTASVQRATGGGFNGAELTPTGSGDIAKITLHKSDGTVFATGLAAVTGSGGAADAIYTGNTLSVTPSTPITFSADLNIVVP